MVTKILILLAALGVLWWFAFRSGRSRIGKSGAKSAPPVKLVACPRCGVHRAEGERCECPPA